MTTFLQLAFLLALILLSAKLAGYLSVRLGQPSVLGELLVGILLGPWNIRARLCKRKLGTLEKKQVDR